MNKQYIGTVYCQPGENAIVVAQEAYGPKAVLNNRPEGYVLAGYVKVHPGREAGFPVYVPASE
jgi:hypothetical protein